MRTVDNPADSAFASAHFAGAARAGLPLLAAALFFASVCAAGQDAKPGASVADWRPMFDGKSLDGWKETPFTAHGPVRVENGTLILGSGYMTGVNWTGKLPTSNYEIRLEASRIQGSDFFAGITFPVGDSFCTWINGGWGGQVVGLSSLDEMDASENETSSAKEFQNGRWYTLRLRVTDRYIAAWIDEEEVIYIEPGGRTIGLRFGEIELSKPFGIASYGSTAGLRKIEYRLLP